MHQFHPDPAANRLLNLLAQLPVRAMDVVRPESLMVAWARHGQSAPSFGPALRLLLDAGLLIQQPEGLRVQAECYALITDELALPIKDTLAVAEDALNPPDPVLREQLLTLVMTAPGGRCTNRDLAKAWQATGERETLLRRALSLCQASGQVSRTRWGKRKLFVTLAGRRWITGRTCTQPLLTLARELQHGSLPPDVRDEELSILALGAFKTPKVGAKISSAHMTHFLWRCGVPESLWFHAIEVLHRSGLVDTTGNAHMLKLTADGCAACKRRRSIRERARLTRTVELIRSTTSEPADQPEQGIR